MINSLIFKQDIGQPVGFMADDMFAFHVPSFIPDFFFQVAIQRINNNGFAFIV